MNDRGTGRPRMLDLYCCEGGCAVGYERAGFEVIGLDINPQPRYPFEFIQDDAIDSLEHLLVGATLLNGMNLNDFAAIHASPTCQTRARVTAWRGSRDNHPDTLTPTLDLLRDMSIPWIVENVTEAVDDGTLRPDFMLCGSMFGLPIRRHRAFEVNWPASFLVPKCAHRRTDLPFEHKGERAFADAMGCDWMTSKGGRQAIPPAYTEFIGAQLLDHLRERAA